MLICRHAGSINSYSLPVSKHVLQQAVEDIISTNKDIVLDTINNYIIDNTNGRHDTIEDNRYNDRVNYVTIKVLLDGFKSKSYQYTFQYTAPENSLDSAQTSYLSIAYAFDENSKGGSEGDGGVSWTTPLLKKKLIKVFQQKLIDRIDRKLNINHHKGQD